MKRIFFTISILIFTLSSCLSQEQVHENKVKKVSDIHDQYQNIEAQSIKYDKIEKDILGESSEGGTITGYYDNGKLKKISVEIFGEIGKVNSDYYLNSNGFLFFVLNQTTSYTKPIYIEGSETKSVEKEEYYYDGDKLFKWVKSKIEQRINTPEFNDEGKRFLDNFKHYKAILGDYGEQPGITVITGTGSSTKQYRIKNDLKEVRITYEFFKDADQLIIEDLSSKILYTTNMISTDKEQFITIPVENLKVLVLKIKSESSNSRWKIKVGN